MRGARERIGLGLAIAGLSLASAATASAALSYPQSDGSDGACSFPFIGTGPATVYTIDTETGEVRNPDISFYSIGRVDGPLRVFDCTTLSVGGGVIIRISGAPAPDFRATGDVQIDGTIDVSSRGAWDSTQIVRAPGPGSALLDSSTTGGNGSGPAAIPAAGGGPGGGGGAGVSGGGGGGGLAGGGGGAGGDSASSFGGNGGGPTGGPGGNARGAGGQGGGSGADGGLDGEDSDPSDPFGGGGGGGAYGDQQPFHPGSGGGAGGGGGTNDGGLGGGGGGALRITSATSIELGPAATIRADGAPGGPGAGSSFTDAGGGGGGGSGGAIQLISPAVAIPAGAAITARGGIGYLPDIFGVGAGGNGGPGRIDVTANEATIAGAANPPAASQAYSYSLDVSVGGPGSVSSLPAGIDCGSDCDEDFMPGAQVSLSAQAIAGASFGGWGGGCTGTGACVLTMDADRQVSATFSEDSDPPPGTDPPDTDPPPAADPPDTAITRAKVKKSRGKATFRFGAVGGQVPATFACKLDRQPFRACSSPQTYRKLKSGKHTFRVRAIGADGSRDGSAAAQKFRIKRRSR